MIYIVYGKSGESVFICCHHKDRYTISFLFFKFD